VKQNVNGAAVRQLLKNYNGILENNWC